MVRHLGLHHKKARGPNKNLTRVHLIEQNKGERTNVGGVVGHIKRRFALILLKQPPPTQIPSNLTLILRHMAMIQTIASCFI
jgi:hypothetical protein